MAVQVVRHGLCAVCVPLSNEYIVLKFTCSEGWFPTSTSTIGKASYMAPVLKCTAASFLDPALTWLISSPQQYDIVAGVASACVHPV